MSEAENFIALDWSSFDWLVNISAIFIFSWKMPGLELLTDIVIVNSDTS